MFESVKEMTDAVKPAATVLSDRVSVSSAAAASPEIVDRLAWTAAFGADAELRGTARWIIRYLAAAAGIRPASIHDLYMAMGRGEAGGFTVPAINVRAMAYDTARAVIRSAKALNAGAFIFEIARSEIGYTEQRPHEYAAIVLAAALREGFSGPIFIQGDHVQTNAKKYNSPDRDKELDTLRALIKEEIAAGFYNIDIDTSTLVDLDKPTLDEQQEVNVTLAADFAAFIRKHEPPGVTVSVGGEIGEVGGKNSDVHELHAYMKGFNREAEGARRRPRRPEQDQRADRHRARRLRQRRRQRPDRREDRSEDARGAVAPRARRSTASAAPSSTARRRCRPTRSTPFRESGPARSIWRPTSRTWSTSIRSSRPTLKAEMYAWVRENALEERKPKDTEEQFIYKARKKAIGPFKQRMWSIAEPAAQRHRPVARGAVHVPDAAAEDRRHGRSGREVRHARRRCPSTARRRSSPPAARSPPRRRRPKGSPTSPGMPPSANVVGRRQLGHQITLSGTPGTSAVR